MLYLMASEMTCGECGAEMGGNPSCEACREWARREAPTSGRRPPGGEGMGFIKALATGKFQPPRWVWAVLIVAFLYLLYPLDLIPDIAFPVGLVDDLLVLAAALTAMREAFARYRGEGREEG